MKIDWAKVERFYRAGVISLAAIARKCSCSRQIIYKMAKKKEWTRDLAPKVRQRTERKLLEDTVEKKPGKERRAEPNASAPVDDTDAQAREREDEALVEAAARAQAEVTRVHRVEAARLIGICRDLGGKLVDVIEGRAVALEVPVMKGGKATGEKRVYFPFLGKNESLSDALVKVSRALKELVTLERKAFGMDEKEDNPEQTRDMVPLEERLATYRREEQAAEAEAGNVVEFPQPD